MTEPSLHAIHSNNSTSSDLPITRRELLRLVVGSCFFCGALPRLSMGADTLPPYCAMDPAVDLGRYRARSSTGDHQLDHVLILELRSILKIFGVNPGFRIIDDQEAPNAFAIPRSIVKSTRGTVLFGINLVRSELENNLGGFAVAGIAAHECAHIFQFFSRYGQLLAAGQRTGKKMELHADFIAGFYLGKDKIKPVELKAFARSLYGKGDWNFNNPLHHGTPDERVEAMSQGHSLARQTASIHEAAEQGANFVSRV